MAIEIRQVRNKKEKREFITFAWQIYRKDPELNKYWVPPVIDDYMKTLDTEKFPLYDHAELAMFTAWKDGVMAGTVAAVENRRHNEVHHDGWGSGVFLNVSTTRTLPMPFSKRLPDG